MPFVLTFEKIPSCSPSGITITTVPKIHMRLSGTKLYCRTRVFLGFTLCGNQSRNLPTEKGALSKPIITIKFQTTRLTLVSLTKEAWDIHSPPSLKHTHIPDLGGDHFARYINVYSPCCTPETSMILYVDSY